MKNPKKKSSGAFGRATTTLKASPQNPIYFIHQPILGSVDKGSATIKNWEYFNGILIQIAFITPEGFKIEGSGVMVAPGIAYCAKHVISPHLEDIVAGRVTAVCTGITEDGMQLWGIKGVTSGDNSDISILALEFRSSPPKNNLFTLSQISTRTPSIGEKLTICGFKASKKIFKNRENGVIADGAVWMSTGQVLEVFPERRDRVMLPWPCLAIDASSTGGMSGGPVYDKTGSLIGLLCSSIEDDENGVSYVSLIWPSLVYKFKMHWPLQVQSAELTLLDLPSGVCKIDKPQAIIHLNDETGMKALYKAWS